MDNVVVAGREGLSREDLLALVASQARLIEEQATQIAQQAERIAQQAERIGQLERRLSRNSGNSSMPPSTDDLPGRATPGDKPARGGGGGKRRRGKQRGAPGAHLAWRADPDEMVGHFPAGACGCGVDLAGAADLGVASSHQVHDIPPVSATVVQHDLHRVRCGCGAVHVARRPDQVAASATSYGTNVQALCVYLLVAHAVPVERCVALVEALTGAAPSVGFVHGMLTRAADALVEADKRIRTLVTLAYVVGVDETPLRVGPRKLKRYLLVAATRWYTYFMVGDRSLATFKRFVLPDLAGVVVHDRYAVYDSPQLGELVHQLCCAHLLRDLADLAECYPSAIWPTQIADALRGLIHAANLAREQGRDRIDSKVKAELVTLFRHGVMAGRHDIGHPSDPQPAVGAHLLEVLYTRQGDVLRFVDDLRVPPTNNDAEQAVRPAKTQQKISGRLTSEKITAYRYRIAGYLSTAAKHGVNTIDAIRDALAGRPWMPPDPAPA